MNITPNSEVRLIKNVPFSNNYRNTILFETKQVQESYFLSLPNVSENNFKYQRSNGTISYPLPKDEVLQYNYLMYKNNSFSNKWFYAFITNVSYVNPKTCLISFELDVFQTWFFDIEFQPSYIERQHCKRWNSDGSPVINTVPESLDYGSEYEIKNVIRGYDFDNKSKIKWLVLGFAIGQDEFTTTSLANTLLFNGGVYDNIIYSVIPLKSVPDLNTKILFHGNNDSNVVNYGSTAEYLVSKSRYSKRLVGKLKTFYVTDYLPIQYDVKFNSENYDIVITSDQIYNTSLVAFEGETSVTLPFIAGNIDFTTIYEKQSYNLGNKYQYLKDGITESKLLMYPYSVNVLTDLQGNMFEIKNEYVEGNNLGITVNPSISISNKIAYTVDNYLGSSKITSRGNIILDNGIINSNNNSLSVIDDYTSAYIQGNLNTIKNNVAMMQQNTGLNNQIAQRNASTRMGTINIQYAGQQGQILNDMTYNSINSLMTGNLLNGARSISNGLRDTTNAAIQNMTNVGVAQVENQNMINNTKAKGELSNQQAINTTMAQFQDARNKPDNVVLQGGNAQFTYGYQNMGFYVLSKQITKEYINLLQSYFQKYGYAYHRIEKPNLKSRKSWNYIQTVGANIIGNIPQVYIDALENIFNSGLTIWHTTDVGNYSLNNDEI